MSSWSVSARRSSPRCPPSLLFVALCRVSDMARGVVRSTLVYGLGTSTWSISSQALWPHALARADAGRSLRRLFCSRDRRGWMFVAGVVAAVGVANRPQMIVFAGARVPVRVPSTIAATASPLPALPAVAAASHCVIYNLRCLQGSRWRLRRLRSFQRPRVAGRSPVCSSARTAGCSCSRRSCSSRFWGAVRVWRREVPAVDAFPGHRRRASHAASTRSSTSGGRDTPSGRAT